MRGEGGGSYDQPPQSDSLSGLRWNTQLLGLNKEKLDVMSLINNEYRKNVWEFLPKRNRFNYTE